MRTKGLFKWVDAWMGIPLVWILSTWRRLSRRPNVSNALKPGARVLVVKFSALGDTLLLLPLLKALKETVGPQGRLEMVATPVNQDALKGLPWLDQLHVVNPAEILSNPFRFLGLLLGLRHSRFDVAIDFDQWLRISALISFASGAPVLAGFKTKGQARHFLYSHHVENRRDAHEFDQFKDLAACAGLESACVEPYAGFLRRERLFGVPDSALREGNLVVLHPGTGGWQREWPVERFARLAEALRAEGRGLAFSGAGARERELVGAMGHAEEILLDEPLEKLAGLLCRARLLVCGNTGVMHLAAGLGIPVLALHGPTSDIKWGPLGIDSKVLRAHVPCSPCLNLGFDYGCPFRVCMESISEEEVTAAAGEMTQ